MSKKVNKGLLKKIEKRWKKIPRRDKEKLKMYGVGSAFFSSLVAGSVIGLPSVLTTLPAGYLGGGLAIFGSIDAYDILHKHFGDIKELQPKLSKLKSSIKKKLGEVV